MNSLRVLLFVELSLLTLLLVGCGPDPNSYGAGPAGVYVKSCENTESVPLSGSVDKMSLDVSRGLLYVLDNYGGISRWARKPYDCGWELDYSWQTSGTLQFNGFVQDLDVSDVGSLYVKDGTQLISVDADTCMIGSGGFAISPDGSAVMVATTTGTEISNVGHGNCNASGANVGFGRALAVDANSAGFVTIESVGGKVPERLVAYDATGATRWTSPLSVVPGVEPYLCSADRIRSNGFEEVVLDKTCHRLLSFDAQGNWVVSISLDSLGIRGSLVHDMDEATSGVAELLYNGMPLTVQVSWRGLIGKGLKGVIESTTL